jgi:hypothetical protein
MSTIKNTACTVDPVLHAQHAMIERALLIKELDLQTETGIRSATESE